MSQIASSVTKHTSNGREGNNNIALLIKHKALVVSGLVADVIYALGAASFVYFAALELNGRERDDRALVTYTIAFVAFLATGFGELYIDLTTKDREVRHGRYSTKKMVNLAISFLFVTGTALDTVAFFLWIERDFVTEHRVLYASSHAWLLTAILALGAQIPECSASDSVEVLDDFGNLLFFVGAVIDCIVRYTDTNIESGSPPRPVAILEFSSSPCWLASAFCFTLADSIRVHKIRKNENYVDLSSVRIRF